MPAATAPARFAAFNRGYAEVLGEWGVLRAGHNPVARSNVCPRVAPPAAPAFHAFAFTVPADGAPPSFVVAGSGESIEGKATYRESTVAYGDKGVGTNHTLPTGRAARYTGGLWAGKFIKTVTYQRLTPEASRRIAPIMGRVCHVEGMLAHEITADVRYRRYAPKNA